jgi:hypothetical protein
MMVAVLFAAALMPAAPEPLILQADQKDYQALTGAETSHEGVLERNAGTGKLGGRFNAYRLATKGPADKPLLLELVVTARAHLLAGHVGRRVRIMGKLADQELWPGRLELLDPVVTVAPPAAPGIKGVHAQCLWQPEEARRRGTRPFIFLDGTQLAKGMRMSGPTAAQTATEMLARQLGVPAIDWKRHMVVTVAAGLRGPEAERLAVTGVEVVQGTLKISYKLQGGTTGGIGYPAATVLVDRLEGPVQLHEEPAAGR